VQDVQLVFSLEKPYSVCVSTLGQMMVDCGSWRKLMVLGVVLLVGEQVVVVTTTLGMGGKEKSGNDSYV
jgi:hypothetical protein